MRLFSLVMAVAGLALVGVLVSMHLLPNQIAPMSCPVDTQVCDSGLIVSRTGRSCGRYFHKLLFGVVI
jgi:energy-converting hydrogenase Eha subunit F